MEDIDGFKEMMKMDFEHYKVTLNLIKPDVTP